MRVTCQSVGKLQSVLLYSRKEVRKYPVTIQAIRGCGKTGTGMGQLGTGVL